MENVQPLILVVMSMVAVFISMNILTYLIEEKYEKMVAFGLALVALILGGFALCKLLWR